MKLRRLEIENFGTLAGRELDFEPGFQVVFGANEAGKSTLLQVIRETLFGFPLRSPYAFAEHAGEMAATAVLDMADGSRVRYRRRKGRNDVVVGQVEPGNRPLDANGLNRLLGNASGELYQHVFGFSLAELTSGNESLEKANLNEALFGGGLGGLASFETVKDQLQKEAEQLFTPTATSRKINKLLSAIKTIHGQINQERLKPRDYQKQVDLCQELTEKDDALRSELETFQAREARLARVSGALGPWLNRNAALQELSQCHVPDGFPADGDQQMQKLRERWEQQRDELEQQNQQLSEKQAELDRIQLAPGVLAAEAEIRGLNQEVGKIAGFRRDLPKRQAEYDEKRGHVLATLRELNPDWDESSLERYRAGLERQHELERLKHEHRELTGERTRLAVLESTLREDVEGLQARLARTAPGTLPAALAELVDAEADYQAWLASRKQLHDESKGLQAEADALIAQLDGPLHAQLDYQQPLAVPLEPTIQQFATRIQDARQRARQAEDKVQTVRGQHRQRQDQLERMEQLEPVPDRQQLLQQRTHRDRGWQLIRQRFVQGETVAEDEQRDWQGDDPLPLADRYERAVAQADQLADRRQELAERAAQRDQLTFDIQQSARHLEQAESELEQQRAAVETVLGEWSALWQPCGLRPLEPDAMLQWLRNYLDLVRKQRRLAQLSDQQQQLQPPITDFESRLRTALNDPSAPIKPLLIRARQTVQSARDEAATRRAYQEALPDKERELGRVQQQLAGLDEQMRQWQARWTGKLAEYGLPTNWDVELATRILAGLSDAGKEYQLTSSLDKRMRDMRGELEQFEQSVASLCRNVAPELADLPAETAMERLGRRLEDANKAEGLQARLSADVRKLTAAVADREKKCAEVQGAIDKLLAAAGLNTQEEFQRAAEAARRCEDLQRIIADADREIRVHRGTESEAEFVEALEQADQDSIGRELQRLREQLEQAKRDREEALKAKTLAQKELDDMQGQSAAAGTLMNLESARGELAAAANRWAPLVLAQTLMQRAIKRFEQQHQPAMLVDVQRLFGQLTGGRYERIERKLDQQGTLLIVDSSDRKKEPGQLSTGTREQLYLAIRLAYVLHYCRGAEPLPIVMDDVLVNFDDERALQTLRVLREVSQQVQILLLTCHDHLLALARQLDPACQPLRLE
ncbi:MAG: AAA family ATPase [Pirellulaceae bacterium]|nr:AAA family ATPase [Pirellulaceae bacterium]